MSDITYERKNIYKEADAAELKKIFDYCEGYKKFLDGSKTEREAVKYTINMLTSAGYREYKHGNPINKNDKLYYDNRGKALFILRVGNTDLAETGIRILVAHVDSPRLDLKQNPLYEEADMSYL